MNNLASFMLTVVAVIIQSIATPMGVVLPVIDFRLDRPNGSTVQPVLQAIFK